MLLLVKNQPNKVFCTLSDVQLSATTVFLFEFQDAESKTFYYTIAANQGTSLRAAQFTLNLVTGSTADPLQSQIHLHLKGQYHYKVYENPLSGTTSAGLHLVEQGRAWVYGADNTAPYYSTGPKEQVTYQRT